MNIIKTEYAGNGITFDDNGWFNATDADFNREAVQ